MDFFVKNGADKPKYKRPKVAAREVLVLLFWL